MRGKSVAKFGGTLSVLSAVRSRWNDRVFVEC